MDEAQEAQTRQVFKQLENALGKLTELDQVTNRLKERLAPVLRTRITEDPEEKMKEPETLVPLALDIKNIANRVDAVVADITDLLKVLEL